MNNNDIQKTTNATNKTRQNKNLHQQQENNTM